MKKFKQFINTIKKQPPIIPAAIHFKHIPTPKIKTQTPTPIHFKHVKEDVQTDKPIVGHINDWHAINDNDHLTKQIPESDEHKDEIAEKLKHGQQDIPSRDARRINQYTSNWGGKGGLLASYQLNNKLINGGKISGNYQNTINSLDNTINNNRIQYPVSLYSGVGFDPENHIDENGQMQSPAYISATHSRSISRGFAADESDRDTNAPLTNIRHIIQFHLNPNDPAMHISHLSDSPREYETLIGRDQTLQHHGTSDYEHPEHKKIYRIHHMSIVPSQGK